MKLIIFLVVVGVVMILYATPAYYLKNGVGKSTPEEVSQYISMPSQSTDYPDGTTVSIYTVEKIQLLCVEYVVTFKNKLTSEDASQQLQSVKTVLSKWTWRWCQSEKKG